MRDVSIEQQYVAPMPFAAAIVDVAYAWSKLAFVAGSRPYFSSSWATEGPRPGGWVKETCILSIQPRAERLPAYRTFDLLTV